MNISKKNMKIIESMMTLMDDWKINDSEDYDIFRDESMEMKLTGLLAYLLRTNQIKGINYGI